MIVKTEVIPLNVTAVAPVKFVPVMVTTDVTGPVTGENEVTVVADQDNGAIASAISHASYSGAGHVEP